MAKDNQQKGRQSGEIWVVDFTMEAAITFREQLLEESSRDPSKPIIVRINSYGGYADALSMMIETMDEIPNPIITVCMGIAASCGAILLSHGDIRFMGNHSRTMIHEVSSATSGDVHDMHADAVETKRLNKHFLGLLAKNCKIKGGYDGLRKLIKERDGRDIYLDANDAVKFGIADLIGTPRISTQILHEIGVNISNKPTKLLKKKK